MSQKTEIKCSPLRGRNKFSGIFRKSKKITADNLYALAVLNFKTEETDSSSAEIFFAVNVRKKIVKHAVCRNRIRRLVRCAVREAVKEEHESSFLQHVQYLPFFWTAPLEKPTLLSLDEVKKDVEEILHKLEAFYNQKLANIALNGARR